MCDIALSVMGIVTSLKLLMRVLKNLTLAVLAGGSLWLMFSELIIAVSPVLLFFGGIAAVIYLIKFLAFVITVIFKVFVHTISTIIALPRNLFMILIRALNDERDRRFYNSHKHLVATLRDNLDRVALSPKYQGVRFTLLKHQITKSDFDGEAMLRKVLSRTMAGKVGWPKREVHQSMLIDRAFKNHQFEMREMSVQMNIFSRGSEWTNKYQAAYQRILDTSNQLNGIKPQAEVLAQVDAFTGTAFEHLVAQLYRVMGYCVKRVGGASDGGVDLVASKGEEKLAIQCKRYGTSNRVGVDTVQILNGALHHPQHGCSEGIIVTTSDFTRQAKEYIRGTKIKLISRRQLFELISKELSTPASELGPINQRVSDLHQQLRGIIQIKHPEQFYGALSHLIREADQAHAEASTISEKYRKIQNRARVG